MPANDTVLIEGARIIFRNFTGVEGQYNREGDRNFAVLLDEEIAQAMAEDGWNIKYLRPREGDEGAEPQAYVQVSVSYENRPPRIMMITSKGRTELPEDLVSILDDADIENVDLIIRPYNWSVGGRGGVKAYLKKMYVTIREDELDMKYSEIPDAIPTRSGKVEE